MVENKFVSDSWEKIPFLALAEKVTMARTAGKYCFIHDPNGDGDCTDFFFYQKALCDWSKEQCKIQLGGSKEESLENLRRSVICAM